MAGLKTLIAGAGVAGVVGVAVFTGVGSDQTRHTEEARVVADSGYELCLKNDIPFFEDVKSGCYSSSELAHLMDARVVDRQNDVISMEMSDPSDSHMPTARCETCRQYQEMRWEGWYALTSRDQRREAFFLRACGTLRMLIKAKPAAASYFSGGSPDSDEILLLQRTAPFAITESENLELAGESEPEAKEEDGLIESERPYEWRLRSNGQLILIQELANADFDDDEIEEILAFSAVRLRDGTAVSYGVGLFQKDSTEAPLVFIPLDFAH